MQRKNNSNGRNGRSSTSGSNRTFYAVLAGATLLMSGFAATVALLGSSLSPGHLAAHAPVAQTLALSQAMATPLPAPVETAPGKSHVRVIARAALPAPVTPDATATVDPAEVLKKTEAAERAKARQAAKLVLAEELARLQLTRSLLAARTGADPFPAETDLPAPQATVALAAHHSVGASARASVDVTARPAPLAVASLSSTAPANPGAIRPPAPGIKPEPAQRSSTTNRTRSKPVPEEAAPVLAYANPGTPEDDENGVFGGLGKVFKGLKGGLPGAASKVAVYDISAATVHMPDGTKLEAHSGIGHRMDNPKYAYVKNYGPTPPNVYRLRMRERRFHGVEAIRMLPTDRAAMKGRDGMLTHTRLLRRSIGSHGCVAFKDYNKFLKAFKRGKVKTLIVVPSMEKLPTYMAQYRRSIGA